ncbi:uncharacterized protein UTRI_06448 [Ustilago trichophora]|uniref:Uncharacterized protein n=1 Tax=Ustilago trichophora TaxID=86804 RepID=A0A5C3EIY3_9BASI|nr:uncharacterized protein UTRI_06448 [Ustilago trichophora]
MASDSKEGRKYLEEVIRKATWKKHLVSSRRQPDQRSSRHYHFGAWYDLFGNNLTLTSETIQRSNEAGKAAVADFCIWFKNFAKHKILPLVIDPSSGLCPEFHSKLNDRMEVHFPWAARKVPGLQKVCHPLYSTIAAINGLSGKAHRDLKDADGSMLVNFGQTVLLELSNLNCCIKLQPLDIVIFRTNLLKHRTIESPNQPKVNRLSPVRWAVACFFRKALELKKEPKRHDILFYMDRAEEEYESRRNQKNRRRKPKQAKNDLLEAKNEENKDKQRYIMGAKQFEEEARELQQDGQQSRSEDSAQAQRRSVRLQKRNK